MNALAARRTALIADADGWRGPRATDAKEWQHFIVFGPRWLLLFNLSVEGDGHGQVIALLGDDGGATWCGEVVTVASPRYGLARIDAEFGEAGVRFVGGRYEVWQRGDGVRFEATLSPTSTPSLTHNISLGLGAHVSWCLVPRLAAVGWVERNGRRHRFDRCLAYHDHNWGRFSWGGDFSWDWGALMPDDPDAPWSAIVARMNDRARHRTTATSLFLLRDGEHVRYLRNAEVVFTSEGTCSAPAAHRIPSAAALLSPDRDRDVPARLRFDGARGDEPLTGAIEAIGRSQVLVPADDDLRRVVRMNEVHGRAHLAGHCAGEPVALVGPALLEVVRG